MYKLLQPKENNVDETFLSACRVPLLHAECTNVQRRQRQKNRKNKTKESYKSILYRDQK